MIAPQAAELDDQLDLLLERGGANGAEVRLIDEDEFQKRVPDGRTAPGRDLWSPNTCVVKPTQYSTASATAQRAGREFCAWGEGS